MNPPASGVLARPTPAPVVASRPAAHSYQALLLSALVDLGTMRPATDAGLTAEHFPLLGDVYQFVTRYAVRYGRPPTREQLAQRFPRVELPPGQGPQADALVEAVRQDWLADRLGGLMSDAAEVLTRQREPLRALELLGQQARELSTRYATADRDLDLADDWRYFFDEAMSRVLCARDGTQPGIRTGFQTLDRASGGIEPGELVTAVARQGDGKSWALLFMAANAVLQGKTVNFHPLEMAPAQVGFRVHVIIRSLLKLTYDFKNLQLTMGTGYDLAGYKDFLRSLDQRMKGRLKICDARSGFSPVKVLSKLQEHQADIAFVDYLTLMQPTGNRQMESWAEVRALTSELKGIAMDRRVPVVVAAQANRVAAMRKTPPELHEIAFGDAVGMDSDRVLSFKRVGRSVTAGAIIKNRHGRDRQRFWLEHDYNAGVIREVTEDQAQDLIDGADDDDAPI